jgi:gliding motility-associated protein GldM
MAGGKLSPRQKMINMMYLVLIALLALNVSAQILKAFNLIENSFESSKKNMDAKNVSVMKAIQKEADQNPAYKVWVVKSEKVHAISENFCKKIEAMRTLLVTEADGRKPDDEGHGKAGALNELMRPDNMEIHANYYEEGPGKQGQGKVLQKLINDTRTEMLNMLNDPTIQGSASIRERLEKATALKAEDEKSHGEEEQHGWIETTLLHTPLAGIMTMLNKYMNDCKNLESDVLNELSAQVHAKEFKFDNLVAKVIPKSTMVLAGDKYEADIILSAYNSQQDNPMFVGGSPIKVEAGVGKYSVGVSEGERKYKGEIVVNEPGGGKKTYPFEGEYMGFKSSATISAEKMNVLYIGLDNPVKVSVPGFPPENVTPTITGGGTITGSKGTYTVVVPPGVKEVTINANVKSGGKSTVMGNVKFRVKNVPKPFAQFGIKAGGNAKAVEIQTTNFVSCGLGPEFAFEGLNYTVLGYSLAYSPRKGDAVFKTITGNAVPSDVKGVLAKCKKGDLISIYNIKAQGPGRVGVVNIPTSIVLNVE